MAKLDDKYFISEELETQVKIVYEDLDIIVLCKPSGIIVHPAPGSLSKTLIDILVAHYQSRLPEIWGTRCGIVHRLDKETSGLLIVAKTNMAYYDLIAQFSTHQVERAYKALVWGIPVPESGIVNCSITRCKINRRKMSHVRGKGKYALTYYATEKIFSANISLVECRLATGRTHQIRTHMTSIGHPLVGDWIYGRPTINRSLSKTVTATLKVFPRQALHAYLLGFYHPRTKRYLCFQDILPHDISSLINCLDRLDIHYNKYTTLG